jgi:flagellar motor switch protein FliN/FliY
MAEGKKAGTAGAPALFEGFVRRLAAGLQTRVEGKCEAAAPERAAIRRDAIAANLPQGALVARTAWTAEGQEGSGCFLWLGDFGALLGGGRKPATELSPAEVETLGQSLRINVQEGGDDDFALQWTDPELVKPDGLADALREAGIPPDSPAVRHVVKFGEDALTFLFLEAPGAAAAQPAPAPEAAAATAARPAAATAATAAAAGPPRAHPAPAPSAEPAAPAASPDDAFLAGVLDLPLSLQVRLGTTHMSLDELLHLIPGSVIELEQREEEPLEVLANGRVVARGEVVVVDERFGVRITEIVAARERLAAV